MLFILVDDMKEQIVVRDGTGEDSLSARVTAAGTDGLLAVAGQDRPLQFWEFSRLALEPVFFGN